KLAKCAQRFVPEMTRLVASFPKQVSGWPDGVTTYKHLIVDVASDRPPLVRRWRETVTENLTPGLQWFTWCLVVFASIATLLCMISSMSWNRGSWLRLLTTAHQFLVLCFVSGALEASKYSVLPLLSVHGYVFVIIILLVVWARCTRQSPAVSWSQWIGVFAASAAGSWWVVCAAETLHNQRLSEGDAVSRMRHGLISTLYVRCSVAMLFSAAPGLLLTLPQRPHVTASVFIMTTVTVFFWVTGVVYWVIDSTGVHRKINQVLLDLVLCPDSADVGRSVTTVLIGTALSVFTGYRLSWPSAGAVAAFVRVSTSYPVLHLRNVKPQKAANRRWG
ncbi:MAG: hypothetical protein Q8J97_03230, partial [Flavobacteriaceae bacterium]|nr:hypothetical protein [Flavobacteriaceae bacterium]